MEEMKTFFQIVFQFLIILIQKIYKLLYNTTSNKYHKDHNFQSITPLGIKFRHTMIRD